MDLRELLHLGSVKHVGGDIDGFRWITDTLCENRYPDTPYAFVLSCCSCISGNDLIKFYVVSRLVRGMIIVTVCKVWGLVWDS